MKLYNFRQNSLDWDNIRLGKITASNINTLLSGKKDTKETYIFKKAAERLLGMKCESDNVYTSQMERGHELEPQARFTYELISGNNVNEVGFVEKDSYIGCSPDGLVGDDGLVEIKTKDNHLFMKIKLSGIDAVEKSYLSQCQFQMWICERQWCDLTFYNQNFGEIKVFRIKRDEETIKQIEEEVSFAVTKIKEIEAAWDNRNDDIS